MARSYKRSVKKNYPYANCFWDDKLGLYVVHDDDLDVDPGPEIIGRGKSPKGAWAAAYRWKGSEGKEK